MSQRLLLHSILLTAAVWLAAEPSRAQTYVPPRTPDGRPDLQGIWRVMNSAAWDIQDHSGSLGVPAGQSVVEGNEIPYQAWALEQKRQNYANRATADPESRCYLPGVPRITYMGFPFQIVQTPNYVAMAYEWGHAYRIVYTNGTTHPDPGVEFWMGDSRGRYEGDTLVVDVANHSADTWFDRAGNFHSEAMRLVERYTRIGPDHIRYEVTVEDPKVFTRPWKMSMVLYRQVEPGFQILEYECHLYALEETAR
jgi:hypothetical protein